MSGTHAPIALFVYNRPAHFRRTVDALRANHGATDSDLFVFSDGPANDSVAGPVAEVRAYAHSIVGFRRVVVVERPTNFGLANSIIDGVTRLCSEYGRAIAIEDDLVTSPHFLDYLNGALSLYEHDDRVASVHAYLPPVAGPVPETFFLYGADCWGWATWKRGWDLFEPDAEKLLAQLRKHIRRSRFDYIGRYPNTQMLRGFLAGRNNSWAIRWHASAFLKDRLTLHPGRTLVRNIGMDGSGTHCSDNDEVNSPLGDVAVQVSGIPVTEDRCMWDQFRKFYVTMYARRAIRKLFGIRL